MRKTSWCAPLTACALWLATAPAHAWEPDMDELRICNKHPSRDVVVAYAAKAVPGGFAALLGAGWSRGGWYQVRVGHCAHVMVLRDVQNYEIWLHVRASGGTQVHWPQGSERFCVHDDAFEARGSSLADMQRCRAGERLEAFSYMTSLYNVDDAYSIHSVSNRTIDLAFNYDEPEGGAAPPQPAAPPARRPAAVPAPPTASIPRPVARFVQICTPLAADRNGNLLPAALAAIASGAMARHFARIDEIVNAMKANPQSHVRSAPGNVQLVVSPFDLADKRLDVRLVDSATGLRCGSGYRSELYHANAWLAAPGLSPRGMSVL